MSRPHSTALLAVAVVVLFATYSNDAYLVQPSWKYTFDGNSNFNGEASFGTGPAPAVYTTISTTTFSDRIVYYRYHPKLLFPTNSTRFAWRQYEYGTRSAFGHTGSYFRHYWYNEEVHALNDFTNYAMTDCSDYTPYIGFEWSSTSLDIYRLAYGAQLPHVSLVSSNGTVIPGQMITSLSQTVQMTSSIHADYFLPFNNLQSLPFFGPLYFGFNRTAYPMTNSTMSITDGQSFWASYRMGNSATQSTGALNWISQSDLYVGDNTKNTTLCPTAAKEVNCQIGWLMYFRGSLPDPTSLAFTSMPATTSTWEQQPIATQSQAPGDAAECAWRCRNNVTTAVVNQCQYWEYTPGFCFFLNSNFSNHITKSNNMSYNYGSVVGYVPTQPCLNPTGTGSGSQWSSTNAATWFSAYNQMYNWMTTTMFFGSQPSYWWVLPNVTSSSIPGQAQYQAYNQPYYSSYSGSFSIPLMTVGQWKTSTGYSFSMIFKPEPISKQNLWLFHVSSPIGLYGYLTETTVTVGNTVVPQGTMTIIGDSYLNYNNVTGCPKGWHISPDMLSSTVGSNIGAWQPYFTGYTSVNFSYTPNTWNTLSISSTTNFGGAMNNKSSTVIIVLNGQQEATLIHSSCSMLTPNSTVFNLTIGNLANDLPFLSSQFVNNGSYTGKATGSFSESGPNTKAWPDRTLTVETQKSAYFGYTVFHGGIDEVDIWTQPLNYSQLTGTYSAMTGAYCSNNINQISSTQCTTSIDATPPILPVPVVTPNLYCSLWAAIPICGTTTSIPDTWWSILLPSGTYITAFGVWTSTTLTNQPTVIPAYSYYNTGNSAGYGYIQVRPQDLVGGWSSTGGLLTVPVLSIPTDGTDARAYRFVSPIYAAMFQFTARTTVAYNLEIALYGCFSAAAPSLPAVYAYADGSNFIDSVMLKATYQNFPGINFNAGTFGYTNNNVYPMYPRSTVVAVESGGSTGPFSLTPVPSTDPAVAFSSTIQQPPVACQFTYATAMPNQCPASGTVLVNGISTWFKAAYKTSGVTPTLFAGSTCLILLNYQVASVTAASNLCTNAVWAAWVAAGYVPAAQTNTMIVAEFQETVQLTAFLSLWEQIPTTYAVQWVYVGLTVSLPPQSYASVALTPSNAAGTLTLSCRTSTDYIVGVVSGSSSTAAAFSLSSAYPDTVTLNDALRYGTTFPLDVSNGGTISNTGTISTYDITSVNTTCYGLSTCNLQLTMGTFYAVQFACQTTPVTLASSSTATCGSPLQLTPGGPSSVGFYYSTVTLNSTSMRLCSTTNISLPAGTINDNGDYPTLNKAVTVSVLYGNISINSIYLSAGVGYNQTNPQTITFSGDTEFLNYVLGFVELDSEPANTASDTYQVCVSDHGVSYCTSAALTTSPCGPTSNLAPQTTSENTAVTFSFTITSGDGLPVTVSSVTALDGNVQYATTSPATTINVTITYTPDAAFTGLDEIQISGNDGSTPYAFTTTITVTAVDQPPVVSWSTTTVTCTLFAGSCSSLSLSVSDYDSYGLLSQLTSTAGTATFTNGLTSVSNTTTTGPFASPGPYSAPFALAVVITPPSSTSSNPWCPGQTFTITANVSDYGLGQAGSLPQLSTLETVTVTMVSSTPNDATVVCSQAAFNEKTQGPLSISVTDLQNTPTGVPDLCGQYSVSVSVSSGSISTSASGCNVVDGVVNCGPELLSAIQTTVFNQIQFLAPEDVDPAHLPASVQLNVSVQAPGGADTLQICNITVNNVNLPPVVTVNPSNITVSGASATLSGFSVTDPNSEDLESATVSVTYSPTPLTTPVPTTLYPSPANAANPVTPSQLTTELDQLTFIYPPFWCGVATVTITVTDNFPTPASDTTNLLVTVPITAVESDLTVTFQSPFQSPAVIQTQGTTVLPLTITDNNQYSPCVVETLTWSISCINQDGTACANVEGPLTGSAPFTQASSILSLITIIHNVTVGPNYRQPFNVTVTISDQYPATPSSNPHIIVATFWPTDSDDSTPFQDNPPVVTLTASPVAVSENSPVTGSGYHSSITVTVFDPDSDTVALTLSYSDATIGSVPAQPISMIANGAGNDTVTFVITLTPNNYFTGTITLTVNSVDNQGTPGSPASVTVTVNAVDQPPTITTLTSSSTLNEDNKLQLPFWSVADIDTPTLIVVITATAGAILTASSGGGVVVSGSGTSSITLTGSSASINAFFGSVTLAPATHSRASITLSATVSDGSYTVSATPNTVISIVLYDYPPTLTASNLQFSTQENTSFALSYCNIVLNDFDANDTLAIEITQPPTPSGGQQQLLVNNQPVQSVYTALTTSDVANLNQLLQNIVFVPATDFYGVVTITIIANQVSAGNATSTSGTASVVVITVYVTAVDNSPVVSASFSTSSISEVSTVGFTVTTAFITSDIDYATPSCPQFAFPTTTLCPSGACPGCGMFTVSFTVSSGTSTAPGVLILPASGNFSGSTGTTVTATGNYTAIVSLAQTLEYQPAAYFYGTATITGTATDDVGVSASASGTVTVTFVNHAPSISASPTTITITETNQTNPTAAQGAAFTITATDLDQPPQALTFTSVTLSGPGNLTGITVGTTTVYNGGSVTLTFIPQQYQWGSVSINVTVQDSQSATSTPLTLTVIITHINFPPTLSGPATEPSVPENNTIAVTGVTLTDNADPTVTQTLSIVVLSCNGTVSFSCGSTGATCTASTIVGTPAQITQVLTTLVYTPPDPYWFGTADIHFTDMDNQLSPSYTETLDITVTVTQVNHPPTLTVSPNYVITNENVAVTLPPYTIADPDPATQTMSFVLTSSHGGITYVGTAPSTVTIVTNTDTITLSGTRGDLQTALAGGSFLYTPDTYYNGNDTVNGALIETFQYGYTVTAVLTVVVNHVNQPPQLTATTTSFVINEGTTLNVGSLAGFGLTDPDVGDTEQLTIQFLNSGGTADTATFNSPPTTPQSGSSATYTGSVPAVLQYLNALQITAGQLDYGSKLIELTVTDGGGLQSSLTLTLSITFVDHAPTVTGPTTFGANAGNTVTLSGITTNDVDGDNLQATVTATSPLTFVTPAPTGCTGSTSQIVCTGSNTGLGTILSSIQVQIPSEVGGAGTISFQVIDLGPGRGLSATPAYTPTVTITQHAAILTGPATATMQQTQTSVAIQPYSVNDPDGSSVPLTLTVSLTALSITGGGYVTLSGGITVQSGASYTVTSTVGQVQTLLSSGIQYYPNGGFGNAQLTVSVSGSSTSTVVTCITVQFVNTPPIIHVQSPIYTTSTLSSLSVTGITVVDNSQTVTITVSSTAGATVAFGSTSSVILTLNGATPVAVPTVTVTPVAGFVGSVTVTLNATDAGYGAAPLSTIATFTVAITTADDPIGLSYNGVCTTVLEAGFQPNIFQSVVVSYVDSTTDQLTMVITVLRGTLTSVSPSSTTVSGNYTTYNFVGTISQINQILQAAGFQASNYILHDGTSGINITLTHDTHTAVLSVCVIITPVNNCPVYQCAANANCATVTVPAGTSIINPIDIYNQEWMDPLLMVVTVSGIAELTVDCSSLPTACLCELRNNRILTIQATAAQINAVLATFAVQAISTPTVVSYIVYDTAEEYLTTFTSDCAVQYTWTINLQPLNPPPVVLLPQSVNTLENTNTTVSVYINDTAPVQIQVTLQADSGYLATSSQSGTSLMFVGSASQLTALLATLTYVPAVNTFGQNGNPAAHISVTVVDTGAPTQSYNIPVFIQQVVPTLSAPNNLQATVNQQVNVTISILNAAGTYTLILTPTAGGGSISGVGVTATNNQYIIGPVSAAILVAEAANLVWTAPSTPPMGASNIVVQLLDSTNTVITTATILTTINGQCAYNGATCDDNDPFTINDNCQGGVCIGTPCIPVQPAVPTLVVGSTRVALASVGWSLNFVGSALVNGATTFQYSVVGTVSLITLGLDWPRAQVTFQSISTGSLLATCLTSAVGYDVDATTGVTGLRITAASGSVFNITVNSFVMTGTRYFGMSVASSSTYGVGVVQGPSQMCCSTAASTTTSSTGATCQQVQVCTRQLLTCPHGQVLTINSAIFGRTDGVTCGGANGGNTNCSLDVSTDMQRKCNNREQCTVIAESALYGEPCWSTPKYLNIGYCCGATRELDVCQATTTTATLTCPTSIEHIIIQQATFGVTPVTPATTCSSGNVPFQSGCLATVTAIVQNLCQGVSGTCSFNIASALGQVTMSGCSSWASYNKQLTIDWTCDNDAVRLPAASAIAGCPNITANSQFTQLIRVGEYDVTSAALAASNSYFGVRDITYSISAMSSNGWVYAGDDVPAVNASSQVWRLTSASSAAGGYTCTSAHSYFSHAVYAPSALNGVTATVWCNSTGQVSGSVNGATLFTVAASNNSPFSWRGKASSSFSLPAGWSTLVFEARCSGGIFNITYSVLLAIQPQVPEAEQTSITDLQNQVSLSYVGYVINGWTATPPTASPLLFLNNFNSSNIASEICQTSPTTTVWGSSHAICGASGNSNIASIWTITFAEPTQSGQWQFRFGIDFGYGMIIILDGNVMMYNFGNLWWNDIYTAGTPGPNGPMVYSGTQVLSQGVHTLTIYGAEDCCDGNIEYDFQRNGGTWQTVTTANLQNVVAQYAVPGIAPPTGICAVPNPPITTSPPTVDVTFDYGTCTTSPELICQQTTPQQQKACRQTLPIQCPPAHVLNIVMARYGRAASDTTTGSQYASTASQLTVSSDCFVDTTTIINTQCGGQSSCSVQALDSLYTGCPATCSGAVKYLEINYWCVQSSAPVANTISPSVPQQPPVPVCPDGGPVGYGNGRRVDPVSTGISMSLLSYSITPAQSTFNYRLETPSNFNYLVDTVSIDTCGCVVKALAPVGTSTTTAASTATGINGITWSVSQVAGSGKSFSVTVNGAVQLAQVSWGLRGGSSCVDSQSFSQGYVLGPCCQANCTAPSSPLIVPPTQIGPVDALNNLNEYVKIQFESFYWNSATTTYQPTVAYIQNVTSNWQSQPSGYCSVELPSLQAYDNHDTCSVNGVAGSNSNLAIRVHVEFYNPIQAQVAFRVGPDWGFGGYVQVNGQVVASIFPGGSDIWWAGNWASSEIVTTQFLNLAPGLNILELHSLENCCDGDVSVEFMYTPNGTWTYLSKTTLQQLVLTYATTACGNDCQCSEVMCTANPNCQWLGAVCGLRSPPFGFCPSSIPIPQVTSGGQPLVAINYNSYKEFTYLPQYWTWTANQMTQLALSTMQEGQSSGYCSLSLTSLGAFRNGILCGSSSSVLWNIIIDFYEPTANALWMFRFGIDWGDGGYVYLDGILIAVATPASPTVRGADLWWNGNWASPYVVYSNVLQVSPGPHTLTVFAFEPCCDGTQDWQFNRNNGGWNDITTAALNTVAQSCQQQPECVSQNIQSCTSTVMSAVAPSPFVASTFTADIAAQLDISPSNIQVVSVAAPATLSKKVGVMQSTVQVLFQVTGVDNATLTTAVSRIQDEVNVVFDVAPDATPSSVVGTQLSTVQVPTDTATILQNLPPAQKISTVTTTTTQQTVVVQSSPSETTAAEGTKIALITVSAICVVLFWGVVIILALWRRSKLAFANRQRALIPGLSLNTNPYQKAGGSGDAHDMKDFFDARDEHRH